MRNKVLLIVIFLPIICFAQKEKKKGKLGTLIQKAATATENAVAAEKIATARADSLHELRPGYETKSSLYYNEDLADKPLPGYYVLKDGRKVDAIIGYQRPQFIMGLSTALFIAKEANNQKIDALNANQDPNFKEWVKYDDLKAFFVANQLFARNSDGNFAVIIDEGAIHTSGGLQMISQEQQLFKIYPITQKLNGEKFGSMYNGITKDQAISLVDDAPGIAEELESDGIDIYEAFTRYNIWYEDNHPGEVEYIFGKDYGVSGRYSSGGTTNTEASAAEKAMVASIAKANLAPRVDPFEGRSTDVDPSIASAKPEVTVKKESFTARVQRIKADGNKVGILVRSSNLLINPKPLGDGLNPAMVKGSYGPLTGLGVLARATADRLNESFGTDVFEVVDYQKIPYKDGKYGKYDDWWSTKYKIVILYDLTPFYNAFYRTNTSNGELEYVAYERVNSELILMAAEEEKPDKLRYVIGSPRSMGSFISEDYIGPKETDFDIIQELKAAINPPSDDEIIKLLIENQKEPLAKLIKKLSK
jgi:hypothetical protein